MKQIHCSDFSKYGTYAFVFIVLSTMFFLLWSTFSPVGYSREILIKFIIGLFFFTGVQFVYLITKKGVVMFIGLLLTGLLIGILERVSI